MPKAGLRWRAYRPRHGPPPCGDSRHPEHRNGGEHWLGDRLPTRPRLPTPTSPQIRRKPAPDTEIDAEVSENGSTRCTRAFHRAGHPRPVARCGQPGPGRLDAHRPRRQALARPNGDARSPHTIGVATTNLTVQPAPVLEPGESRSHLELRRQHLELESSPARQVTFGGVRECRIREMIASSLLNPCGRSTPTSCRSSVRHRRARAGRRCAPPGPCRR